MHAQFDSADPMNGNRPPQQGCQGRAGKNRQVDVVQEYGDARGQSSERPKPKPKKEKTFLEQQLELQRIALIKANPPRWMSGQDAAHYTGYSENYVCREAVAGRLPSRKRGKTRRFHVDDLDAWVRGGRS